MAKPTTRKRKGPSAKVVGAVTLVLALALTIVAAGLGLSGMKLDKDGLYHLLAWIPSPIEGSTWRQALVPGTDLGENLVQTYSVQPLTEGETVSQEQLDLTLKILSQRLAFGGWRSARVALLEDGNIQLTLPQDGTHAHAFELLAQRGEIGFASPDGAVFMTQDNIRRANYAYNPTDGTYAVGFVLDSAGRTIFGDKTRELLGQSMSLMVDGAAVASPKIGYEPLTQGEASLPGFDQERAVSIASMMATEPLPLKLEHQSDAPGEPLFGKNAQSVSVIALAVASLLVMLYFVIRYRLGGLVAAWLLVIHLITMYFLAALIRSPYTLTTLLGVYTSFGLLAYGLLVLYFHMKDDLDRGRSIRQAVRESFAAQGRAGLEVIAALLLLSVVLIIMDSGAIGSFARILGLGLLLDLVLLGVLHRVLMLATINVFGLKTALYSGARKEAA